MLVQNYKLPITLENIECKPGTFVFIDDDSTDVIGFVDFASDCEISIMLFEPMECQPGWIAVSETCDALERLIEILKNDLEMYELWASVMLNMDDLTGP